jgi:hypothetical protein
MVLFDVPNPPSMSLLPLVSHPLVLVRWLRRLRVRVSWVILELVACNQLVSISSSIS